MKRTTGSHERSTVVGEHVGAFVPHSLPPSGPPLQLEGELNTLLNTANEKLRLLDLAGDLVPSVTWFVYAFVRKEAVLSAQIEGTQTTLMDLFEVEASEHAPRWLGGMCTGMMDRRMQREEGPDCAMAGEC